MTFTRRTLLIGSTLGTFRTAPAFAQGAGSYPDRPITILSPSSPGSSLDLVMRLIAEKLRLAWGQTVLIDSKPGAGGSLAATLAAKAQPDGYTLAIVGTGLINNLFSPEKPNYRLEDFAPVCLPSFIPSGIGVRATLGVKNLQDFVAMAKANPGKLTYGSAGIGSGTHITGELLRKAAGIDIVHVPYKGEPPAMQDLVGGSIDAAIQSVGGVTRFPGKVIPLALASPQRFSTFPDLPTFAELGYPEANLSGWAALFAPAATPRPVLEKWGTEIARIVALPDVAPKLLETGHFPAGLGPARLAEVIQQQLRVARSLAESGQVKFG